MKPIGLEQAGEGHFEVLCLGAHSDDLEIGCGGTLLRMREERPDLVIHWVVLSAPGPRREEAISGSGLFRGPESTGNLFVGDFRDGFFPDQWAAIKGLLEEIRGDLSPDLIFTHFRDDRHQDHRVVSELTWNTWRDHAILEYEVPKWDGDLGVPNAFVPLSAETAKRKSDLVLSTFLTQQSKPWFSPEVFLGMMRLRGMECRAPEGFAEAFYARKSVLF